MRLGAADREILAEAAEIGAGLIVVSGHKGDQAQHGRVMPRHAARLRDEGCAMNLQRRYNPLVQWLLRSPLHRL